MSGYFELTDVTVFLDLNMYSPDTGLEYYYHDPQESMKIFFTEF